MAADMRLWAAPEPADILVSELLGSFGDNELSPECLDGAQRFLAPGGISIPAASTSQLCPVTAAKLWNDAKVRQLGVCQGIRLFRRQRAHGLCRACQALHQGDFAMRFKMSAASSQVKLYRESSHASAGRGYR